jgi:hypothetical protein
MHKYDNELRQKMESMYGVPTAFRFDAASAWKKMEAQLLPVKKKKKLGWVYWAAASIVLVTASVIMFGSNKHQAKEMVISTTKENKEQPNKPIVTNTSAIANSNHIVSSSKEQKTAPSPIKEQALGANTKVGQAVLDDSTNKQQSSSTVQANISEAAVSISNSITVKPLTATTKKARLKVIHINELDAPPPSIIAKLDSRKQLSEQPESNSPDNEPSKPFWQKKPKQVNPPSSFTDNQ